MSRYIDADKVWGEAIKRFEYVDDFAEVLEAVPTEDVRENVHGEWIKICWKAFRCSECKQISEYYTDFCPNCGAIMDGKKGENNGLNQ